MTQTLRAEETGLEDNPALMRRIEEEARRHEPQKPLKQPIPGTKVYGDPRDAIFDTDLYVG